MKNVWPLLASEDPKITFHLLPMEKLGLPDDLYIKMNSRGKELTEFEYIKSQLSEILPKEFSKEFNDKIDQTWSDLFWNLYKDDQNAANMDIAQLVDDGFLRFFNYITDILVIKNNIQFESSDDALVIYEKVYSEDNNVRFLVSCLNAFSMIEPIFFADLFYTEEGDFDVNKTRLYFQDPQINLFKKCADRYDTSQRSNPFSIGEQLLLYACIEHLVGNTSDFNMRIRGLRNLINNSEDTVRKENMTSLITTVSGLIQNNSIEDETKFNKKQVEEEVSKQEFIHNNNSHKESIYKLEDHHLLRGCLAAFELNDTIADYAEIFESIFKSGCDYDLISRALLSFGDYTQRYDWHWRKRFGNNNDAVWRELLTPSQRRDNFQSTKDGLYKLMTHLLQNPEMNLEKIIDSYLSDFQEQNDKPKDWRYYFIKYPEFRKNDDGFYYWKDIERQYECIMMRRSIFNGWHWSPFLYTLDAIISW